MSVICLPAVGAALCGSVGTTGALPISAVAVSRPATESAPITAPLEVLMSRHIAVQVKLNGKGPFRLILDTGSPITFISNSAAQKSGLITAEDAKQPMLLGMHGMKQIDAIDVGDLHAHKVDVLILDHPTISLLDQVEAPIDGILGFTFFAHYRTTIDYQAGTISFTPVKYDTGDIMGNMFAALMQPSDNKRILTPAALYGLTVAKSGETAGVQITQIYPHSAAEAAGLHAGDRLLTLDGRWTDTINDCYEAASLAPLDQEIKVKVLRGGKEMEIAIRPRPGL